MVPKTNDLYDIHSFLTEKFGDAQLSNVTLSVEVDKNTMKKVNEDFFYRGSSPGKLMESDEVIVMIGNLRVRYYTEEKEEE